MTQNERYELEREEDITRRKVKERQKVRRKERENEQN